MTKEFGEVTGEVTIEVDGKKFYGTYTLETGKVTVRTPYDTESAHCNDPSQAEFLARTILKELVVKAKKDQFI